MSGSAPRRSPCATASARRSMQWCREARRRRRGSRSRQTTSRAVSFEGGRGLKTGDRGRRRVADGGSSAWLHRLCASRHSASCRKEPVPGLLTERAWTYLRAFVSARSSAFAKACFSFAPYAAWPPVSTPELRRLSMKSLIDSRSPMISGVYSSPRGSMTTTPFGTRMAASGMSAVTTTSPFSACSAM